MSYAQRYALVDNAKSALESLYANVRQIFSKSLKSTSLLVMDKNILDIQSIQDKLKKIEVGNDTIFEVAHLINTIENILRRSRDTFNSLNIRDQTSVSHTYIVDTVDKLQKYNEVCGYIANDKTVVNSYIDMSESLSKLGIEELEKRYITWPNSNVLYAEIIKYIIGNAPENRDIAYEALDRARTFGSVKDGENMGIVIDMSVKDNRNFPVQRFGLMPVRQSQSIKDLTNLYFPKLKTKKSETIKDFLKIAKMKKVNVLIQYLVTPDPLEFRISKLYNLAEFESIREAPEHGVNGNIIERFETVRGMPLKGKVEYYKLERYRNSHLSGHWIVIRTLNNDLWDALSDKCVFDIAKSKNIDDLLNSLTVSESVVNRMVRGASPRIATVQAMKNHKFAKFLIQPQNYDSEVKLENKQLIHDLINIIVGRITNYIDKSLIPLPTSKKELEIAIRDKKFVEIMNEEILSSYDRLGICESLPTSEMLGTFVSDIDTIIIPQFSRALKMNMIEMGPKKKMFLEHSGEDLHTRIYNIFVSIIERSVRSTIVSKENIYEKVLVKNNMLKMLR